MEVIKNEIAAEITQYGDHVWHNTTFLCAQLKPRPALILTVKSDEKCREKHRKEIHNDRYPELVPERKLAQITEKE